jgi:hypothetical protein
MKLKLALVAILCALTVSPVPAAAQDTDSERLAVVQAMMQAWKNSDWRKVGVLGVRNGKVQEWWDDYERASCSGKARGETASSLALSNSL